MNDLITRLDEYAINSNFPFWDNANSPAGAMRAVGLFDSRGAALIFQVIAFAVGDSAVQCKVYAYGAGASHVGYDGWSSIVDYDALVEDVDDNTIRSRITNVVLHVGNGADDVEAPAGGIARTCTLRVANRDVTFATSPLALPGIGNTTSRLWWLSPGEVALFHICDAVPRDALFPPPAEVAKQVGMDGARVLFVYDDWQHVTVFDPPSSSPDIVAMVEALAVGRAPEKLPGQPNCNWRHFLEDILDGHAERDDEMWGPPETR